MELPSKILEPIVFSKKSKTENHILKIVENITHGEHLCQTLQTINEQVKIAVTFLTVDIGIFNVSNKNDKLFFTVSINDDDLNQMTVPPGAY